jgi:hypothetical protein
MKRKRSHGQHPVSKRRKTSVNDQNNVRINHPVLSCYYDAVFSLRNYLLQQLKPTRLYHSAIRRLNARHEDSLDIFLDSILVGFSENVDIQSLARRKNELETFSRLAKLQRGHGLDVELSSWTQRDVSSLVSVSVLINRLSTLLFGSNVARPFGQSTCFVKAFSENHSLKNL